MTPTKGSSARYQIVGNRGEGDVVTQEMSELTVRMREILEPLGEEERRRAIEAAIESRPAGVEDPVVRGVELAVNKPRRPGATPSRYVRVVLTARTSILAHEALIDTDGSVISQREIGPVNLPYTSGEVEEATAIAIEDKRVSMLLDGLAYGVGTFAPSPPASSHRLVGLHFVDVADPDLPQPIISVIADLAVGALTNDEHHQHDSRED